MPNREYVKGRTFEYKIIADLKKLGYVSVRSAGSKGDHKIDIVALTPGMPIMLIQAKVNGKISKVEWDALYMLSRTVANTVPVVASNGPNGRGVFYRCLLAPYESYARIQASQEYVPAGTPELNDEPRGMPSMPAWDQDMNRYG